MNESEKNTLSVDNLRMVSNKNSWDGVHREIAVGIETPFCESFAFRSRRNDIDNDGDTSRAFNKTSRRHLPWQHRGTSKGFVKAATTSANTVVLVLLSVLDFWFLNFCLSWCLHKVFQSTSLVKIFVIFGRSYRTTSLILSSSFQELAIVWDAGVVWSIVDLGWIWHTPSTCGEIRQEELPWKN